MIFDAFLWLISITVPWNIHCNGFHKILEMLGWKSWFIWWLWPTTTGAKHYLNICWPSCCPLVAVVDIIFNRYLQNISLMMYLLNSKSQSLSFICYPCYRVRCHWEYSPYHNGTTQNCVEMGHVNLGLCYLTEYPPVYVIFSASSCIKSPN